MHGALKSQHLQVRQDRARRHHRRFASTSSSGLVLGLVLARVGVLDVESLQSSQSGPVTVAWLAIMPFAAAIAAALTYFLWLGMARLMWRGFASGAQ